MDFYTIPAPVHVWTFNKNEGEFHTLKCSFNSTLPPNRTSGWRDEGTLQPSYDLHLHHQVSRSVSPCPMSDQVGK